MNTTHFLDVEANFANGFNAIFDNQDYQTLAPYIERGFHSIKKIEHDSLLFVGLNPSFAIKKKKGRGKQERIKQERFFYDLSQKDNTYKKFFGKFEKVSEETGLHWSHLDMLVMRETQQKSVQALFEEEVGKQFIEGQLNIAKQILEQSKPKVIVVANTLARQFLGKDATAKDLSLGYNFEFNETIGTDLITNSEKLGNIPVFFTSMLSGQRAIDKGSYQRLVWHIKFALKHLKPVQK